MKEAPAKEIDSRPAPRDEVERAQRLIDHFFKTHPDLKTWHDKLIEESRKQQEERISISHVYSNR